MLIAAAILTVPVVPAYALENETDTIWGSVPASVYITKAFYEEEIAFRKLHLYPPFCSLCMVQFAGAQEGQTAAAARSFGQQLRQEAAGRSDLPLRILGPAPSTVAMLHGKYRYKLTIKCRNDRHFRELLRGVQQHYSESGYAGKISVSIDFYSDSD